MVEDANDLEIILSDGSRQSAEMVGTDIYADLAVLKYEAGELVSVQVARGNQLIEVGVTLGEAW